MKVCAIPNKPLEFRRPSRVKVPEMCDFLNNISRAGVRQPCPMGAWIHVYPEKEVCMKCMEKNGRV